MSTEKSIDITNSTDVSFEELQLSIENISFIPALKAAYDLILLVDISGNRVRFIHGRDTSDIGPIYDIEMNVQKATDFWLNNYIDPAYTDEVQCYLNDIPKERSQSSTGVSFELKWTDKRIHSMFMIGIRINESIFILCCRDIKASTGSALTIPAKGIFVRTFGHFDVFVNGIPVIFSSSKEKELLALLIDRNGGTLTSNEGISYLWDIDEPDERVKAKYRKLAMNLRNTLESYGISHIVKNAHGTRSIDPSLILCDYYELLKNNEMYRSAFHNTYMSGYKWNESTLSLLWDYS